MTDRTDVRRYRTDAEAAAAGASSFASRARRAVAGRGRFTVALSGGETPRAMYETIAAPRLAATIDWDHVHLLWGDDRGVPPEHPRSNFRMAREALVDRVPIPSGNVHRIRGELAAPEAARAYEEELRALFGAASRPVFDLIHLGVGEDGHTASLFPGAAALKERERDVIATIDRAHDDEPRVTFTIPLINAARAVEFLVLEPDKAEVVRRILAGSEPPEILPARAIRPAGELVWFLSDAAAERLVASAR